MGVVALVAIHNRYGHSVGIFAHIWLGRHLQPLASGSDDGCVVTLVAAIVILILAEDDIAIQLIEHGAHTLVLEFRVAAKRVVVAVVLHELIF